MDWRNYSHWGAGPCRTGVSAGDAGQARGSGRHGRPTAWGRPRWRRLEKLGQTLGIRTVPHSASQVAKARYSINGVEGGFEMLRGVFVAAVLLSLLASCAAPNYQLANNKGQTARCSSFGAGIVGTLMAVSMAQTCVNEYQKQGYHQVPVSAPAAPQRHQPQLIKRRRNKSLRNRGPFPNSNGAIQGGNVASRGLTFGFRRNTFRLPSRVLLP